MSKPNAKCFLIVFILGVDEELKLIMNSLALSMKRHFPLKIGKWTAFIHRVSGKLCPSVFQAQAAFAFSLLKHTSLEPSYHAERSPRYTRSPREGMYSITLTEFPANKQDQLSKMSKTSWISWNVKQKNDSRLNFNCIHYERHQARTVQLILINPQKQDRKQHIFLALSH